MTNFDYEILTTEKPAGVTLEQAREAVATQYPDHHVIVEDTGDEFVATLARKSKVSRNVVAADDDALGLLDSAPEGPGKKKEAPEGSPEEEASESPEEEAKEDKDDNDSDDKPKEEKGDKDDKGEGGDDLSKAVEALKTLEKALPKLKELLGGGDLGLGEDHVETPLHDGLGGDEALGPMPPSHHGPVGPTPGAPPGAALGLDGPGGPGPGGPGLGGPPGGGLPGPPRRPGVPSGRPPMRGPAVGVPTFSKRRNKVVFRPIANTDGTELTQAEATYEIEQHPKYAGYEVVNVKKDDTHYVAHLKLREE